MKKHNIFETTETFRTVSGHKWVGEAHRGRGSTPVYITSCRSKPSLKGLEFSWVFGLRVQVMASLSDIESRVKLWVTGWESQSELRSLACEYESSFSSLGRKASFGVQVKSQDCKLSPACNLWGLCLGCKSLHCMKVNSYYVWHSFK